MKGEAEVRFPSGELELEGILYAAAGPAPFPAVVLCHPHSLYGGSMHTGVIVASARALAAGGIAALAFNFRSVGASQGVFDGGSGEQDDALAALEWLGTRPGVDGGRMGLAGYSFGGGVAAEAACRSDRLKALALLAPSLRNPSADLPACSAAKYVLAAGEDDVVSLESVRALFAGLPPPKKLEVVQGADHYLSGFADAVAEKIARFFIKTLKV